MGDRGVVVDPITGMTVWKTGRDQAIVAACDGVVLAASDPGLAPATGEVRWSIAGPIDGRGLAALIAISPDLVVTRLDGQPFSFDPRTGREVDWGADGADGDAQGETTDLGGRTQMRASARSADSVVNVRGAELFALDPETRERRWTIEVPDGIVEIGSGAGLVVTADGERLTAYR